MRLVDMNANALAIIAPFLWSDSLRQPSLPVGMVSCLHKHCAPFQCFGSALVVVSFEQA